MRERAPSKRDLGAIFRSSFFKALSQILLKTVLTRQTMMNLTKMTMIFMTQCKKNKHTFGPRAKMYKKNKNTVFYKYTK
jgi:hypothetical protein